MPMTRLGVILAVALTAMAIPVGVTPLKAGSAGLVISDPVPDELRERVADLLRIMRPADAAVAIDATRIIDGALWRQHGMLILRVEADCREGLCMTVVTRVKENGLIPEVTLKADTLVWIADYSYPLWGESAHPIRFKGAGSTGIDLWNRHGGWVVDACGHCFHSAEELARRLPPPRTPPLPSPTVAALSRWRNMNT